MYHIDEENSDVIFEVNGNKVALKVVPSGGGGKNDIYLIKVGEQTIPTDKNTFSALRILAEITKKLEEFKKELDKANLEKYLRKDMADSTRFLLTMLGGAKFGDFVTGVLGGYIDEKGNLEMESGVFRKRLFVPEIAYNRTTYFKGRMVNSPGGGCTVLSYVDNGDGTYTITPDLTDADGLSQFVDDILTTYFVTKNSEGKLNGFEEMKFRVTAADYTAKKFTVIPRPGHSDWKPAEQMVLAQTGNFTDPERQTYILIDSVNGNNCITFFDNANTWDPEPAQMPAWFGKKKGMTINGINCDNYSAVLQNIIMTGLIFQIDEITGNKVRVPLDKGEWVSGKYAYYDRVSYNGALWLCVADNGTTTEPSDDNPAWLKQVAEGSAGATGPQGVPGTPGKDAITYYTWIRYADNAQGGGISNNPTGKAYIGFAYNKTTAVESNNPSDYLWSEIKGTDGVPGAPGKDGKTYYTWIAYSDNADGTGMYQQPNDNTKYIGIAVNKETATESSNPSDYTWSLFKGKDGADGLSVIGGGHWESSKTPYKANTMVTLANCVFLSKVETSNPPIRILRVKGGNFLRKKDGGYYLAGKPADWEVNEDWEMLLDGRELKGESITFLGEFATAPANPKNGDSYRNTTDRATYIYQDGRWQLMISDGKDGKDYEYIYTRGNIIDNPPAKPDSQQKDDYIPEGWTDDFVGVDADHQVEWGCKRFKENGVWSEFSTPAVVHRWSKDGENAIMADFDNEMVNAALTSDGKVVSSQTWNTTVSMWYGTEKLTLDSITCTPDTNLLCATDKNTGVITISVSAGAALAATNSVKITIRATKNGQQYSRDLTFTVAGVRGGADGSDAVLYSIIVSATSVSKDKNGNYSVSSVSCYRQKSVGGVISTTTDGTLKYSIDGGAETTINNNTAISSANFTKTLKFVFYVNNQIVDVETVPMVVDGKDGPQGVPGTPGKDAITYYTWIRYADNAQGGGISNNPTGKAYIGFAYNKTTAVESNNPSDYLWSEIKGTDGVPGAPGKDGKTYYTWIAYSDNADGTGMYQQPNDNTKYIGIAVNKETATESSNPSDYTWSLFKGKDGADGLSVIGGGHWESSKTPYKANTMVTLANCVFLSKVETSNPPIRILRVKGGNFLRKKDGGYYLAGKPADWEVNEDWEMLLDGRELKGESITFLGEFATAPANPKNGDSYRNTTDRATYIYQDGRWQLMISDGKDGKDYEYIYTRGNIIDNPPAKPDSQQKDDYIPEGWTDDFVGVDADHQVEWGCKRFKENGVWSEFSTPAVVHRWSKDGENAIMADFDNEMVNAALTSDGKVVSSQTWNTTVSMWYGTEKLTLDSITCTPDTNLLCATDKNTGVITISVSAGAALAATNSVKITIRATKNGQQYSRDLTFTVAGVRGGADGSDAVLYSIIVSATSVSKDKNGNYSVSSVSCYRQKSVGGVISTTTDGTLKYSIDGGAETTINNNTAISSANFTKTLKFVFYVNNQIVDVETVPMVVDGKDGPQGVPGTPGKDAITYYTWIRYADNAQGGGISNNPTGKAYIGFAYNKTTAVESNNPSDYLWSEIKGTDGVPGAPGKDGKTYYTWIAYSDNADGTGMYQQPNDNTKYIGIAVNKETATESSNPSDYTWSLFKGKDGADGLSVIGGGHWESSKTPYKANTMVTLANCVFLSKVETSNPPIRILRVKGGNFLRKKDGGYYLAGKPADWEVNEDWEMLLDGRELKGESITFLGEFATAPANPKNGDSYRNTTDRATYIYQDGRWQLMISDGKDGKDYEYIYTRGNIIDNPPAKPDSQQKDDYIPEGWTDDFVGVDADHQVEWGCKRFKENGVWSEFSTPAVVHRWSKDGENAIMADFDNEMVNAALTSDGKVVSSQTWNTTVSMWYGTEKLTLDSITCTPDTNLLCATDKNTGVITISVSAGAALAATNSVKITIRATKNGQQYSRDLTFTVAGVRGGADGSDAVLYSIIVSATSVSKDKNGNYSVSSVSCYRQKSVGGVISTTTDGTLKYSIDGGAETTINNNTAISSANFTKTLKFVFYVNNQIVDVETVPMVVDGKDGPQGVPGTPGKDGESITAAGHWESANTPYAKNSTVSFAGGSYLSKVQTYNPPLPILRVRGGRYLRKRDGGYILTGARTVSSDWQEMASAAVPSVSYWLDSPVSTINFTSTGTPSPSAFAVTMKQNVDGNVSDTNRFYLVARKYNGSWLAHVGAILSNQISVPATAGYTQFAVRAYKSVSDANAWNDNFVAEKGIGVATDGKPGDKGDTGATGAFPRDRGVFASGQTYVWNADYRDKVIYLIGGVYYNFLVKNYGASVTAAPTSVNGDSNWEAMQKFVNIATDTLFADGANVAGFGFRNGVMASLEGQSAATFDPAASKLILDGRNGRITALDGIFKRLYFEDCFTKNRFLNLRGVHMNGYDPGQSYKIGDCYYSGSSIYTHQSDGNTRLDDGNVYSGYFTYVVKPEYSRMIQAGCAEGGKTNVIYMPDVSESNYGTEVVICVPSRTSTRSITGEEGRCVVSQRNITYTDERTLLIGEDMMGGDVTLVSTPMGWLVKTLHHAGCDNVRVMRLLVSGGTSSYTVSIDSACINVNSSKVSVRRNGVGDVTVTITSGSVGFFYGSHVDIIGYGHVLDSPTCPVKATLGDFSYSEISYTFTVRVLLSDDESPNDGNFFMDVYATKSIYIGKISE